MNRNDVIINELFGGTEKEIRDVIEIVDKTTLKPASSYTEQINKFIDTLSIDPKMTKVFGSFSYKVQSWPADIDLMETVEFVVQEKKQ